MILRNITIFMFTAMLMGGCKHSHGPDGSCQKFEGDPFADTEMMMDVKGKKTREFYGEKFDPKGAVKQSELLSKIGGDTIPAKFEAVIHETCAKAGCWMTVANPDGYPMYVYMKDHAFGVPLTGCKDLKCVVNGIAYRDTLSVRLLKHFAEDAGKSQAEIDAITEPLPAYAVTASGVMIEAVAVKPEKDGKEDKKEK